MANPLSNMLKNLRQKRRLARALSLPMIEARIVHSGVQQVPVKDELAFEIALSYRFEVAGEAAYGSAFSAWMPVENYAKSLVAQIAPETTLQVRYNPKDPDENYALATDNAAKLPFPLAD